MNNDHKHNEVIKFVEEPSNYLKCPVCQQCYRDPVVNGHQSCGHTFCKLCAEKIEICPVDSAPCDQDKLIVNRSIIGQINDLLIYCPYGLILEHDNNYIINPNGCQEQILYGSLEEHTRKCPFAIRNSITNTSDVNLLKVLQRDNQTLRREVSHLKERVTTLETFNTELSAQLNKAVSSINVLQQKVENLYSAVEPGLSRRRSFGSRSESVSGSTKRLSNPTYSPSNSPDIISKIEQWAGPFQFQCIGTYRGHKDVVWCLGIFQGKLYSAGSDCVIKIWDLDRLSKGCIGNLQGHKKRIHCSCIGHGYLYTAGDDLSIKQWNLSNGSQTMSFENAHDNTICSMLVYGETLFTSSFSLIKVWNSKTLTLKHSISGLNHWIRTMAFNTSKDKLYSGSNNIINIWDTSTYEYIDQIENDLGSIYSLTVTKEYIIAGAQVIQLFDTKTKLKLRTLEGHFGTITSLVTSPSGRFLFSGSHDKNIQMWNLETFLPIQTLQRHTGSVNTLALYGNVLLSGSEDCEIKVYKYFQSPV